MFGALAALNPVAMLASGLSLGESALAYKGQRDANESNERIAKENRAFQERMANQAQDFEEEMSSSAYQRAMADMKKSGLNPMLAYQQGGASTPIGKTAPGAGAVMENVFGGMQGSPSGIASTASSIMSQAQERENMRSKLENDKYYRSLNDQQQTQVFQATQKLQAEIEQVKAQTDATLHENVQREIVADFLEGAEMAAMAKYMGIDASILKFIIGGVFGLGGKSTKGRTPTKGR